MEKKNIIFIISGILLLIGAIVLVIWNINNSKKNPIIIDQGSSDRMTELNNVFTSILGSKWPYWLFLFGIILIIFFYILYMLSINGINVTISDNHYKLFSILSIIFVVLFAILIIVLTVMSILNYNYNNKYCVKNFQPADNTLSSDNTTLLIIGLSIFILSALGGGVYYFFFRGKKLPLQQTTV